MPLTELPTEVLAVIARHVGTRSFKRQLSLLSLFKAWYHVALEVLHADIKLNNERFVRALLELKSQGISDALPMWVKQIRTLTIVLQGWRFIEIRPQRTGNVAGIHTAGTWFDEWWAAIQWYLSLNGDAIDQLKRSAPVLERLDIYLEYSWAKLDDSLEQRYRKDVPALATRLLKDLRSTNLKVLFLDLRGGFIIGSGHHCAGVATLLSTLKQLKEVQLQIECICHTALRPPSLEPASWNLEAFTVDISGERHGKLGGTGSNSCKIPRGFREMGTLDPRGPFALYLKMAMRRYAVPAMKSPKVARVVYPHCTVFEPDVLGINSSRRHDEDWTTYVWDCIADQETRLPVPDRAIESSCTDMEARIAAGQIVPKSKGILQVEEDEGRKFAQQGHALWWPKRAEASPAGDGVLHVNDNSNDQSPKDPCADDHFDGDEPHHWDELLMPERYDLSAMWNAA